MYPLLETKKLRKHETKYIELQFRICSDIIKSQYRFNATLCGKESDMSDLWSLCVAHPILSMFFPFVLGCVICSKTAIRLALYPDKDKIDGASVRWLISILTVVSILPAIVVVLHLLH